MTARTVSMRIRVPKDNILNANRQPHWTTKMRNVRVLRWLGHRAWLDAGSPTLAAAGCDVAVTYPDRRRRDAHNLYPTLKALIDGMVSGPTHEWKGRGLLPDDNDHYLTGPFPAAADEPDRNYRGTQFLFVFTEREPS